MGSIVIDDDLVEITEKLKTLLSKKRYIHSIGVMYTSATLAMRYEESVEAAKTAGLLHDCAKWLSKEKLLDKAKKHLESISELEMSNPDLLHSKVGRFVAEEEYGIKDDDILNAIFFHTTGRPSMTMLEKIVFVADYIEPSRTEDIPFIKEIRKMAYCNIDKCVVMICDNSLRYLKMKNAIIDNMTLDTYNYYKNLTEGKIV